MGLKGKLMVAAALLAGAAQIAPAHAQESPGPSPGAAQHSRYSTNPPRTPKEPGARISGRFAQDQVLDVTTHKIRKDGAGPCDSVTAAANETGNSAAIVCDRGKDVYFMRRQAGGWEYAAPPLTASKNRPAGAQ